MACPSFGWTDAEQLPFRRSRIGPKSTRVPRWAETFLPSGSVVELRALAVGGRSTRVDAGYFNDARKVVAAAASLSANVYFTVNEIDPKLLSRAANRVERWAKVTTGDRDVLRRLWLFLDLDAVRPSGIPSTDAEHHAAIERAEAVAGWLRREYGFSEPVTLDSGNGAALFFRIDLPNDGESLRLVKCGLEAVALRFSDGAVTIDTSVANAARIARVPGTLNAKGDSTPERPHRMARLLHAPDPVDVMPRAALEALAATVPHEPSRRRSTGARLDLDAFVAAHLPEAQGPHPWNGGRKWIMRPSPMCDHHAGEAFLLEFSSGAIVAKCHHASCTWSWRELRERFEPAALADLAATPRMATAIVEDEAPAGDPKAGASGRVNETQRKSQSSRLVELCADVELFHARDGEAYGTVAVNDHHETWPVRSSVFRDFLRRRYFDAHHAVPGGQPLGEAVDLIAARARFGGETRDVDLRLAGHEGRIYLDLCNDNWQVVEIGPDGWSVAADAPVRFRRARGMLPLPTPTPGASLELLRPFLNVGDDERRWKLIVGWLVGLFRPRGPHALLAVSGEQGSAKTTQGRILRALHDPNESPDRTTPRSELDLAIAARNARIIVLDNLSGLKPWLSDGLARLATGSGLTTRKLYTDDEESIFHACRPILLNGIAEVPTRSDLLDRSLVVDLPRIPDERRQLESDLWPAFELARPAILGALLSAASCALARERTVTLPGWPRMADFARWVTAAEPALGWQPGSFMEAYTTNRAASHELALDYAAIYAPLQVLIDTDAWQGTASQLLAALAAKVEDAVIRQEGWPKSPRALSALLRDLAPNLRAVGIGTEFSRQPGNGRRRLITITKTTDRDRPDRPEDADAEGNGGEAGTQRDAEADLRDANPEPTVPVSESARDGRDGRDANGGLLKDSAESVGEPAVREDSPEREMARFEL